jgi:hypothetical protein
MRIETKSGHTILADDADYQLLFQYTWHAKKGAAGRFYAWTNLPGNYTPVRRHMSMHRLLMNPPAGMVVHHINNNGLDNRRCNLEVTTNRQNLRYHHDAIGGAYFDKASQRWRSGLRGNDGKLVHIGMFDTEQAALEAAREFRLRRMAG